MFIQSSNQGNITFCGFNCKIWETAAVYEVWFGIHEQLWAIQIATFEFLQGAVIVRRFQDRHIQVSFLTCGK